MHTSHGLYQGIITLRTGIDRLLDGVSVPCGNIKLEPIVAREKSFTSEFQIPVLTTWRNGFYYVLEYDKMTSYTDFARHSAI